MEQIILAFEQEKNNQRVKEILETSGTAACLLCGSADQVRQTVNRRRITAVVCGYKLGAQSARLLAADLPLYCSVLVLATRDQCVRYGVAFHFKQTGAVFIKDGRTYHIPRKLQHSQAARAGIDYPGAAAF